MELVAQEQQSKGIYLLYMSDLLLLLTMFILIESTKEVHSSKYLAFLNPLPSPGLNTNTFLC